MTDQSPQSQTTPVPTVNEPAQDVVNVIEDLAQKGEEAAETAIIAAEPWLGTPVLKQIWETAFDFLVKLIMRPVASLGGRVIIQAEEYLALRNVASAQVALNQAQQKGDPDAILQASQAVDKAVAPIIQYVGATHS
jgi:hypothetical protein